MGNKLHHIVCILDFSFPVARDVKSFFKEGVGVLLYPFLSTLFKSVLIPQKSYMAWFEKVYGAFFCSPSVVT